jgi:hypothetical protein
VELRAAHSLIVVHSVIPPDDQDISWVCSLRYQMRRSGAVSCMGVLALESDRDNVLTYQERSSQMNIYSIRLGTTLCQRCRAYETVGWRLRLHPHPGVSYGALPRKYLFICPLSHHAIRIRDVLHNSSFRTECDGISEISHRAFFLDFPDMCSLMHRDMSIRSDYSSR